MSYKSTEKTFAQKLGIALFVIAMGIFITSLFFSTFELDEQALRENLENEAHWPFVQKQLDQMRGRAYGNTFAFMNAFNKMMQDAQAEVKTDIEENQGLTTGDGEYWNRVLQNYQVKNLRFPVAKASSGGFLPGNIPLVFLLTFVLGIIGAFLYIVPKTRRLPGINNDHIYHSSMHALGWLGIVTGLYLTLFYIVLYFYPEHMVNWVLLVDPISRALNGGPASHWFLYGFLYTLCILVMGVRMIIRYRHSAYQIVRTISVMFFQTAFAFLIPEILLALNQPSMDLKNIWPLNYSFFFDYNLEALTSSGAFGLFLLFWGIALILIAVPVITYFYGKRWYCSWVCGCGGLAETLGDPYRHLSDKRLKAWKIERWLIHGVLVFAVVMTLAVLYSYFPAAGEGGGIFNRTVLVIASSILLAAAMAYVWRRNRKERIFPPLPMKVMLGVGLGIIAVILVNHFAGSGSLLFIDSYVLREWYGFAIGAIFAGVVGVGFYPFMGNRVWCRFGCPLAAYLGLVQKLKSRFRITTNGGQCISCGNCSTYCEMGIDVRWYAQRGQDVVRSSCVGCGICSAVCPRGVLRLENSSLDIDDRTEVLRTIHISETEVKVLS